MTDFCPDLASRQKTDGPFAVFIPLPWLTVAAALPGKSLHIGMALWHLAGVRQSRSIALSNKIARQFSVDRNSKYRALSWLEEAGLITVERRIGQSPTITLLDRDNNSVADK